MHGRPSTVQVLPKAFGGFTGRRSLRLSKLKDPIPALEQLWALRVLAEAVAEGKTEMSIQGDIIFHLGHLDAGASEKFRSILKLTLGNQRRLWLPGGDPSDSEPSWALRQEREDGYWTDAWKILPFFEEMIRVAEGKTCYALVRCEAVAVGGQTVCGRFFERRNDRPGPHQRYCSPACQKRMKRQQDKQNRDHPF
jgi:hypothetical protein